MQRYIYVWLLVTQIWTSNQTYSVASAPIVTGLVLIADIQIIFETAWSRCKEPPEAKGLVATNIICDIMHLTI